MEQWLLGTMITPVFVKPIEKNGGSHEDHTSQCSHFWYGSIPFEHTVCWMQFCAPFCSIDLYCWDQFPILPYDRDRGTAGGSEKGSPLASRSSSTMGYQPAKANGAGIHCQTSECSHYFPYRQPGTDWAAETGQ